MRVYGVSLRIQVPNNHILTRNLYYNYYYPKPKYLIIEYLDPLGIGFGVHTPEASGYAAAEKLPPIKNKRLSRGA